jgi:hypothetical protein
MRFVILSVRSDLLPIGHFSQLEPFSVAAEIRDSFSVFSGRLKTRNQINENIVIHDSLYLHHLHDFE